MRHANKIELRPSVGSLLDYFIDGRSLVVHLHSKGRKDTDFVSPFGVTSCQFESRVASWLLLRSKSALPTGRIPLLFCPRCGDLGCGVVTVIVERTDDGFVWKDFGFETPEGELDHTRYEHVRGFAFTEHDYTETFRRYLVR